MATDWPRHLKILAFKEAVSDEQSVAFIYRKLFRWYSKTFATPLHIVETLPLLDIFQAYYEDYAVNLVESTDNEDQVRLQSELIELCKTDADIAKERQEKEKEEIATRQLMSGMAKDNEAIEKKALLKNKKKLEEKLKRDKKEAAELSKLLTKDGIGARLEAEKKPPVVTFLDEEEETNMSFTGLDDSADLEDLPRLK